MPKENFSEEELAALAWEWENKQGQGVPEPSQVEQEPGQGLESTAAARFFKNIVQSFDPRPIAQAVMSPIETGKGMIAEHGSRLWEESKEKFSEGDYLGSALKKMFAGIPLIGPAADAIGEQMGSW